jgi:hypothetical protein
MAKFAGRVKNPAVVVLALLALGVALFLATRRKEASGPKFRSTNAQMRLNWQERSTFDKLYEQRHT